MNLRRETIQVRGEPYVVRELTAGGKSKWAAMVSADRFCAHYALASLTLVEPLKTLDELEEMSSEVVEAIADCAMRLSGMGADEKKD